MRLEKTLLSINSFTVVYMCSIHTIALCLDYAVQVVPYREAKLSRLFKNYIDRSGNVRMVVCINQEEAYYDETLVSTCCSNSLFFKLCQKCTPCLDLKHSSHAARTEIH